MLNVQVHPKYFHRNNKTCNHNQRKRFLPTPVIIVYLAAVLFGLDFGFMKALKKSIRPVIKYISYAMTIVHIVIFTTPLFHLSGRDSFEIFFYYMYAAQYVAQISIVKFVKYNLYDFIKGIHAIDKSIIGKSQYKHLVAFCVYSSTMLSIKTYLCSSTCWKTSEGRGCNDLSVPFWLYCIMMLSLDVLPVVYMTINMYTLFGVQFVKKSLENSCMDLKVVQSHYMTIANCSDKIKDLYDWTFTVELVTCVPKLLVMIWSCIIFIKNGDSQYYLSAIINVSHTIGQLCGPTVVSQMVNYAVSTIQAMLHDQTLTEKSKERRRDLLDLLRYIEARNLRHEAWSVIPIDLGLPIAVFNICTTYLIVIIQFTHIID